MAYQFRKNNPKLFKKYCCYAFNHLPFLIENVQSFSFCYDPHDEMLNNINDIEFNVDDSMLIYLCNIFHHYFLKSEFIDKTDCCRNPFRINGMQKRCSKFINLEGNDIENGDCSLRYEWDDSGFNPFHHKFYGYIEKDRPFGFLHHY